MTRMNRSGSATHCQPAYDRMSKPIVRVLAFIEENFSESISLAQLAALCNLSLCRFATLFRREVGVPPHRYLCQTRVRQAQSLLRQGLPPAVAAIETGFFDQSHFCRHFKRLYGVTPGQFVSISARPDAVPVYEAGK